MICKQDFSVIVMSLDMQRYKYIMLVVLKTDNQKIKAFTEFYCKLGSICYCQPLFSGWCQYWIWNNGLFLQKNNLLWEITMTTGKSIVASEYLIIPQ